MTPQELQALLARLQADPTRGYADYNPGFQGVDTRALGGALYDGATGMGYMPTYAPTVGADEGSNTMSGGYQTGWRGFDAKDSMDAGNKSILNGRTNNEYDLSGNVTGQHTWSGLKKGSAENQAITALAMMLPAAYLTAAGVAGAGAATAGAGTQAAGAGATEGGTSGLFNAAADSQLANVGIDAAGGNALSGYMGTGGVTASPIAGGGNWYDSVVKALSPTSGSNAPATAGTGLFGTGITGSQALGLGTTALGALGGSKGNQQSATATKTMDPRLDPYFYGEGGLLNMAQAQLQRDQANQAGYDLMKQRGIGLLNTPMRGNGFGLFASGPVNRPRY